MLLMYRILGGLGQINQRPQITKPQQVLRDFFFKRSKEGGFSRIDIILNGICFL